MGAALAGGKPLHSSRVPEMSKCPGGVGEIKLA